MTIEVLEHGLLLLLAVAVGILVGVETEVVSQVVDWEERHVRVERLIDSLADTVDLCVAVVDPRIGVEGAVDGRTDSEDDATLVPLDAGEHAEDVILLGLLPLRIVALQLELLRLEVVAWVVLITEGNRLEVELTDVLNEVAVAATHGQHLDDRRLRHVAAVLATTLTLRNPDGDILLLDGVVDIGRQALGNLQHLADRHIAHDDERTVQSNQVLDPRIGEEVVANGNLGGLQSVGIEQRIEESRVQHDVAVVGDEERSTGRIDVVQPLEFQAVGGLTCQLQHHLGNDVRLELLDGVHRLNLLAEHLHVYIWSKRLHEDFDGRFIHQRPEFAGDILIIECPDIFKFRMIVFHNKIYGLGIVVSIEKHNFSSLF